jgi:hypothetical protein
MSEQINSYLNEVLAEQALVERELAPRQVLAGPRPAIHASVRRKDVRADDAGQAANSGVDLGGAQGPSASACAPPTSSSVADHRITGFWFWKTVLVPPNVYVVHTRRGREQPIHLGLGISFRYNPFTDGFLIIPAAVQTLLINARCICAERQGVWVQGYVQWVVNDIQTAYRRLDFSDPADRMRIVKVQLREQAEAAIKDKVATMSIDAILTDKQPIIAELTQRLKAVAEGTSEGSGGLGLKIVTVQIKDAVVSSTQVWENLQKPFRAEREKVARLAEMETRQQLAARELADRQAMETAELERQRHLEEITAEQERERFDRVEGEKARRLQIEHDATRNAIALQIVTEKARKEADLEQMLHELALQQKRIDAEIQVIRHSMELDRVKAEQEKYQTETTIEKQNLIHQAQLGRSERELSIRKQRRLIDNDLSDAHLRSQLFARLPEIARNLPRPDELKAVTIGPEGNLSVAGLVAGIMSVVEQTGAANGSAKHSN